MIVKGFLTSNNIKPQKQDNRNGDNKNVWKLENGCEVTDLADLRQTSREKR